MRSNSRSGRRPSSGRPSSRNNRSSRQGRPEGRPSSGRRPMSRSEYERYRAREEQGELYKSGTRKISKTKKRKKMKNSTPKVMSDRKRWFFRKINALFLIFYAMYAIFRVSAFFSWKGMATAMMKNQSSVVVDANGNVMNTIGSERIKGNTNYSDLPQNLINAYVDIEDERFFSHWGVDVKRTFAAIGNYVLHGGKSSYGGSTITQQLVKNLTGNDDSSIGRKGNEWIKAAELDSFASKEEILEAYFNIIYTAPNTYGVGMGAKYYFNKDVKDLSLAECAYMAGINVSPNSYNPFGETDNSERIKKRTKIVLKKMLDLKHISQDEYNAAVAEVDNGLNFSKGDVAPEDSSVYSYYTDAALSEVIPEIAKKKHINKKFATNYVYMGGLTIQSAEDPSVQEAVEKEYYNKNYIITSSSGQKSQSAMVIIDHTNGQVKGVAGGLGEKSISRGFNRATQSYRQTGSSIKPIAVLVPGIDKMIFTASTIYTDEPTTFTNDYAPKNNDRYIGDITVRRAVESSQNIPFVKMMEQITPKEAIKYMEKMGITSLNEKDETLVLALGGEDKGITPLEMAGAFATVANDGVYIEPTFYTKVTDSKGKTIVKSKQKKTKVFSKEVAYIVKELLKQPVEGSSGTARACKINGIDVAAKTGTTNNNYDKWLCGFTPYYTAVTWYGYDQGETISYGGRSPAAQLWSAVMKRVHSNKSNATFNKPSGVMEATICSRTGKVANSKCSDTHTEYFLSGTLPDKCVACTGSGSTYNKPPETKPEDEGDGGELVHHEEIQNDSHNDDVEITNVPNTSANTNTNNSQSSTSNNSGNTNTQNKSTNSQTNTTQSNSQSTNNTTTQGGGNSQNTTTNTASNGSNNGRDETTDDDEHDD